MKANMVFPSLAFTLFLTGLPSYSYAHHPPSTSRPTNKVSTTSVGESTHVHLSYQLALYASTKKNADTTDNLSLGKIIHHGFSLDGSLVLSSKTFFNAQIPYSYIRILPPENSLGESTVEVSGIGDASFNLGQRLNLAIDKERALFFIPSLGIRLANGSYQSQPVLSKTDVSAGEGGQLDIETFYTNASLGSGAIEILGRIEVGMELTSDLKTSLSQSWVLPVTKTEDGILWGIDISSSLRGDWFLVKKVFAIGLSFEHLWHLADTIDTPQDPKKESYSSGSRHQLSLATDASIFVTPSINCSLGASLPLYQNVDGLQLVETINAKAGCGFAFAF